MPQTPCISDQLVERMNQLPWLSRCGSVEPIDLGHRVATRQVSNWAEATKLPGAGRFQSVACDETNRLSEHLATSWCPEAYHEHWNNLNHEAREKLADVRQVVCRLLEDQALAEVVCHRIEWDMCHLLMEDAYQFLKPPQFGAKLFPLYEAGHIPCGWQGSILDGTLLYF